MTRTYTIPADVVERLGAVARDHRVGVSDLVSYLLDEALDQVNAGTLTIPTKPSGLFLINRDKV